MPSNPLDYGNDPDNPLSQMDKINQLALGPLYVPRDPNPLAAGAGVPAKLTGPAETTPGYIYHATSAERLQDIADTGKLLTHKPGDFTDQDAWPDGSTQKRNYFTPSAQNTWQFAPEEGQPALLRIPRDAHPVQQERGTGDLYSTKPVPADKLEYQANDGKWYPVSALKGNN